MNVNEIKYYFDPEQLNSYDVSWWKGWKAEQAFNEIREVYADSEYNAILIEEPRKWLNLGMIDGDEDNAQYYSMTQDGDRIFIFLQSVKDGDYISDVKEFRSFEAAQEFVANHLRTEASHIEDARYRVADKASLMSLRNMVKNLKPFYF